ncbi:hypothetical protein ACFL1G_04310 [Planctomycetota bacterium]
MSKNKSSLVKVCLGILLITGLLNCSCKKSPEAGSSGQARQQNEEKVKEDSTKTNSAEPEMVLLETELPRPTFVGTPANISGVTNLLKPRPQGQDRPPFYVPAGTKNVALGKPVSATDEQPIIGDIEMITDGDKEAMDGSYVELAPFLQNVTIDMGAQYEIYAILLWHYHKQPLVYFDVIVQGADDSDFLTNVRTLFNNDIDNSAGLGTGEDKHYVETAEGKLIDAKGQRARYVRLYSNGSNINELNHYIEVEVFGVPVSQNTK